MYTANENERTISNNIFESLNSYFQSLNSYFETVAATDIIWILVNMFSNYSVLLPFCIHFYFTFLLS